MHEFSVSLPEGSTLDKSQLKEKISRFVQTQPLLRGVIDNGWVKTIEYHPEGASNVVAVYTNRRLGAGLSSHCLNIYPLENSGFELPNGFHFDTYVNDHDGQIDVTVSVVHFGDK